MKFKLKYPITIPKTIDRPETELSELDLVDRMQAKHAEKIPDDAFKGGGVNPTRFLPAIAEMSGIDLPVLKQLDYTDVVNIVGSVMMPFLSDMGLTEDQSTK